VPAWLPGAVGWFSSVAVRRAAPVLASEPGGGGHSAPEQPDQHPQRFDRRHRLLSSSDFDSVFRQSQRSADRFFTVLYRPNSLDIPRLGFAISRKKVRHASDRNRLKRLVRESFRIRCVELPAVDLVVLARDAAQGTANSELFISLGRHWSKLKEACL
jgi:ribonuclease P protein component